MAICEIEEVDEIEEERREGGTDEIEEEWREGGTDEIEEVAEETASLIPGGLQEMRVIHRRTSAWRARCVYALVVLIVAGAAAFFLVPEGSRAPLVLTVAVCYLISIGIVLFLCLARCNEPAGHGPYAEALA